MLYMLNQVDATILYTVNNGGVLVLSILYSCILFKEHPSRHQIIGILMAAASMLALSL